MSWTKEGSCQNWVQTSAPALNWAVAASSSDGTKLAAIVGGGSIYTSSDSGTTWSSSSGPIDSWTGIASSSDGSRLAASTWNDGIYLSTNFGASWQQAAATSNGVWQTIACSSDGNVIAAASLAYEWGGELTVGPLFISTNGGSTWTTADLPNRSWTTVACSSNGMVIVAATGDATIYTTTNCGSAWATANTPPESWSSVACSADGTRQFAVSIGSGGSGIEAVWLWHGAIFTSTNSGASWTQTSAPNDYWESVACSTDGTKIVACAEEEIPPSTTLWISRDGGTSWQSSEWPDARATVASSGDGSKLFATLNNIGIYSWQWQPTLTMGVSNQAVVIAWPFCPSGATLQHNSDLTNTNWVDLTNTPTTENGVSQILIPVGAGTDFYRLKLP
jgi:hypothetical protein